MNMLGEGPDEEPLVWHRDLAWRYGSCGIFLVKSGKLPIHRATFSRKEIAQCADLIRMACVNEQHGYRGGIIPIDAGVFDVALAGTPAQLMLGEEEDIISNVTASK